MTNMRRRLDALEAALSPQISVHSRTRELCLYLARLSLDELRSEVAMTDAEFSEVLEEIRVHVPGYAEGAAQ